MNPWSEILPQEGGFGDGASMWFDPDTLGLHIFKSQQSILGIDAGNHLRSALADHPEPSATKGEIFSGVPDAAVDFNVTYRHEQDHLRRILCTSFGLLIHHLQSNDAGVLQRSFCGAMGDRALDSFPVFDSADAIRLRKSLLNKGIEPFIEILKTESPQKYLALYCSRKALVRALVDGIPKDELSLALGGLLTIKTNRERPAELNMDAPEALILKTCLEIQNSKLNGRSLLEFLATYQGLNTMMQQGGHGKIALATLAAGDEYNLIPRLWNGMFGDSGGFAEGSGSNDDFDLSAFRTLPLELFAAVDLALWIPAGPLGLCSKRKELGWADLEPGIRFWRCMDLLKQAGIGPSSIDCKDNVQRFRETQDALANHLGWPTVDELAQEWLAFFEESKMSGTFDGYFLEHPGDKRISLSTSLLRLRMEKPLAVVLNNSNALLEAGFSSWWIGAKEEPREIKPQWEGEEKYYAFKMFVLTKMCSLLLSGEGAVRLSKENMQQALLGLNAYFGQRNRSWPQDEFMRMASVFLKLS
jgi:hypothetical protein